MDEKRKAIFVDNFSLPEGLVQMAHDEICRKLKALAYEGEDIELHAEMPLFNMLGVISNKTDVWTTVLRADLASEVSRKFKPFTDRNNEFNQEEIDIFALEIEERWY